MASDYRHAVLTYCRVSGFKLDRRQIDAAVRLLQMRDRIRADNNRHPMDYDAQADTVFAFIAGLRYAGEHLPSANARQRNHRLT